MGTKIKELAEKYLRPYLGYFFVFLAGVIVGGIFI